MDNSFIIDKLSDLLDFRKNELAEIQEFNNFTEEDNNRYIDESNKISSCIESLKEDQSYKSKFQYLMADFNNYKKRQIRDRDLMKCSLKKDIIFGFLDVCDDMKRLIDNIKPNDLSADLSRSETGFQLIYENMIKTLNSNGCKMIECSPNDEFDVNMHEAVSTHQLAEDESGRFETGHIYQVLQNGWTLDENVIRPVKVIVAEK